MCMFFLTFYSHLKKHKRVTAGVFLIALKMVTMHTNAQQREKFEEIPGEK